jgi:Fe-S-cluster containining protein
LTVLDPRPPGFRFLVNDGERCGALDVSVPGSYPCRIYERRPEDCRIVEPGSPCCLEARRLGRLGTSVGFRRVG